MRVAERPSLLPLIDTTLSNVIDWANTPYWYTGFAPGQVVPSAPHNTLWLLGALWNGYLDYGTVRTDDYLESSVDQRWSTTQLAYNVGDEVITLGAEVDTYVTYYVGGYRIEVDAGLLRPYGALPLLQPGATLPGRLWIYLDYGVITDPAQPVAAIRVESVAAGVPASPAAGELPLVGVDLNALGVVTGNTYDASDPELGLVYSSALPQAFLGNVVIAGSLEAGSLELGGILDMGGFAIINADDVGCESVTANNGVSAGTLTTSGDVEIGGDLDMTLGAISNVLTLVASSSTDTITGTSSSAGTGAGIVGNNSSSGPGVAGVSTSGVGGSFTGGGTNAGANCAGGTTGIGVIGIGGATSGAGVRGTSQGGSSPGVSGVGANSATCHGVLGTAVNTASYGVAGTASAAATTSGAGVRADGLGNAPGLWAVAVDGHAGLFTSDTTSPTRAVIRMTPQDADPSSTGAGDFFPNSSRLNKLRHHDGTKYLSVHSSAKGNVFAFAAGSAGTTLNSGDLATVSITPEEAGEVLITATGLIEQVGDGDSCNIVLRDVTLGATIQTTVERQIDTDAAGVRTRSFVARAVYTLPSAAARSFAFQINGNAAVNVTRSACVLSVMGIQ
jgi:hypothetical protein